MGFAPQSGEPRRLGELPAVPRDVLGGTLEPAPGPRKPSDGYFLRAESFFNVAQFVVATHSPVLLAIPGARIYELTSSGVAETALGDDA